ncbi:MAG: winged helix-turn-helix transcriptional regulator [Limisphaerales bacterium]
MGLKRPHVEYSLTAFGHQLQKLVLEMHQLALRNCDSLKRRPTAGRFARAGRA